jgi:hypothetical protein
MGFDSPSGDVENELVEIFLDSFQFLTLGYRQLIAMNDRVTVLEDAAEPLDRSRRS